MRNIKTRKIAGIGILLAVEIVLAFISALYLKVGPLQFNLALIPIVIAAIMFGIEGGVILGVCNGLIMIYASAELLSFGSLSAVGTIILAPLKTALAGLIGAIIFKKIENKKIGCFVVSIAVPIINTSIFFLGSLVFYLPYFTYLAGGSEDIIKFIIVSVIGVNFLIELGLNIILANAVYRVVLAVERRSIKNGN